MTEEQLKKIMAEMLEKQIKMEREIEDLRLEEWRAKRLKEELKEMKKQLDKAEGNGYPHAKTQLKNIHSHVFNTLLYYA